VTVTAAGILAGTLYSSRRNRRRPVADTEEVA